MSVGKLIWNQNRRPAALATVVLACVAATLAPAAASAQEEEGERARFFQFAFMNPLQVFDEDTSVTGFRLNTLLGVNNNVTGLDVAAVAGQATGNFRGLQLGPVIQVEEDCTGAQIAILGNSVEGTLRGVQFAGLSAYASEGGGVQIAGGLARATTLTGFQLGLMTYADEMKGLQIGLLNFNESGFLPIFPLFNLGL
jgi:hypothetical protein